MGVNSEVIYDPKSGVFSRNGTPVKLDVWKGYVRLKFEGKTVRAHRLAFFLMTGEWPLLIVDHINGNRSDNRWTNLRLCTKRQSNANRRVFNNRLGFKGVMQNKRGFFGRITVQGKLEYGPARSTVEEAARDYDDLARRHHGSFASLNFCETVSKIG